MKKLFSLIAIALIFAMIPFALFSCKDKDEDKDPTDSGDVQDSVLDKDDSDSESDSKSTDKTSRATTIKLAKNLDKIKLLGRTTTLTSGIGVDHTASGIEFKGTFEGDVKLKVKQAKLMDGCDETYFTV